MAYFPFFEDIENRHILIAGGGNVALRKAEKLLPFGAFVKVIAPEICEGFSAIADSGQLEIHKRRFRDNDINSAYAVIAATDDNELNTYISELCRKRQIPVNSVDDPENCTFFFPALVCRENITVGISTGGASPIFARYLREQIEELIDEKMLAASEILTRYRPVIAGMFRTPDERKNAAEELLRLCTGNGAIPGDEEINRLLESL